jgi:tetratricopeptide (TPR) repeat protein
MSSKNVLNEIDMTPADFYKKGKALYNTKQYHLSIEYYDKAISKDKNYIPAYIAKGMAYDGMKQYQDALDCYDKIFERDSLNSEAYYQKAQSYYHLKQYDEAIEYYDKAISLNKTMPEYYANKARCLKLIGQTEETIECLKKAIDLNPHEPDTFYALGNVYIKEHKFEEALQCYDAVIELQYDSPNALVNKAMVLYYLNNYDDALVCLERALCYEKNNLDAYVNQGIILFQMTNYEDAILSFSFAIELDNKNVKATFNKAVSLYMLGQQEGSLQYFNRAIELSSTNPLIHLNKCFLLKEMDELEKALNCIRMAYDQIKNVPEQELRDIIKVVHNITQHISSIQLKVYRLGLTSKENITFTVCRFMEIKMNNINTEREYTAKNHIMPDFIQSFLEKFTSQENALKTIENELNMVEEKSITIESLRITLNDDNLRKELSGIDPTDQDIIIDYYHGMLDNLRTCIELCDKLIIDYSEKKYDLLDTGIITKHSVLIHRRSIKINSGKTFMEILRSNPFRQYAKKIKNIFMDFDSITLTMSTVFKNLLTYIKDDIKLIINKKYRPMSKVELIKKKFPNVKNFFDENNFPTIYRNNYYELGLEDSDSIIDFLIDSNIVDNRQINMEIYKALRAIYLERKSGDVHCITLRKMTTIKKSDYNKKDSKCNCIVF